MPTGSARKTVEGPRDVARDIAGKHVVIHGEDLDNNGSYGGRTTALGAPREAELPVVCGENAGWPSATGSGPASKR